VNQVGIIENYRRAADRHLGERESGTPAAGMPGAWRLRDHPPVIAAAGIAVIILAAVAYWTPGIILVGSVSEVRGICSSGAGLFAQAAESGCARAENWTAGLAVAAIAGAGMIIAGIFLAGRNSRS
jgi:hypothetical protein